MFLHLFDAAVLWVIHWLQSAEGQALLAQEEANLSAALDRMGGTPAPPATGTSETGVPAAASPAYFNPKASSVPTDTGVTQ